MGTGSLDYLLEHELTLITAPVVLGAELSLKTGSVEDADRLYYDTFDGRLHAAGLACAGSGGRLALLDSLGREIASTPREGQQRLLAVDLPPGPMRDSLLPVVDVRALSPLVHIRSRIRVLGVLDEQLKTVVRIVVEQPAVVLADGQLRLSGRLRLMPVRGYDKSLSRVRATLERLGLQAAERSLLDEALSAAGGVPGGVSSKVDLRLEGAQRADSAAAVVLSALLGVIEANLPGTLADIDPEFLHDLRVAVRRTRAVQRELRGVFDASRLVHFRTEFRWLQQVTGPARDLDVYVLDFDGFRAELPGPVRRDLDPLLEVLLLRRADAHRSMRRALESARARALLREWRGFLDVPLGGPGGPLGDAALPIAALAGGRILHVYRRMVRMGSAIDASSPAEQYHELRKQGKELRYLLELFGTPLFPSDVVKPMVRVLKALQDTLGRHQDREIQVAMMRSLGDSVAALPGGAAGLMAMGMLVERLEADEAAAQAEFGERFAAFSSRAQRRLVKDTFP